MEPKNITGIPFQYKGNHFDSESQKYFLFKVMTAKNFEILKKRFFSVNNWQDYADKAFVEYKLYDSSGFYVERIPIIGDYIRIDICGARCLKTNGYNWIRIVDLSNDNGTLDEIERYVMICRPSNQPGKPGESIAHFYSDKTTSTLIIARGHHFIRAGVHLRNELANYSKPGWLEKIKNFHIFKVGYARNAKIQWQAFTDGLLDF